MMDLLIMVTKVKYLPLHNGNNDRHESCEMVAVKMVRGLNKYVS